MPANCGAFVETPKNGLWCGGSAGWRWVRGSAARQRPTTRPHGAAVAPASAGRRRRPPMSALLNPSPHLSGYRRLVSAHRLTDRRAPRATQLRRACPTYVDRRRRDDEAALRPWRPASIPVTWRGCGDGAVLCQIRARTGSPRRLERCVRRIARGDRASWRATPSPLRPRTRRHKREGPHRPPVLVPLLRALFDGLAARRCSCRTSTVERRDGAARRRIAPAHGLFPSSA